MKIILSRIVRAVAFKKHAGRWGFLFMAWVLAFVGIAPGRESQSAVQSGSAHFNHES